MDTSDQQGGAKAKNKWLLPAIILVALIAVVAVVLAVASQTQRPTNAAGDEAVVGVSDAGFTPETIKVKRGQAVTWVNQGSSAHQITSSGNTKGAEGLDSEETLEQNDTFTYTFETSGTYTYNDKLNPTKFRGTVIVED